MDAFALRGAPMSAALAQLLAAWSQWPAIVLLSLRISAIFLMTPVLYAIPLPRVVRALLVMGLSLVIAAALGLCSTIEPTQAGAEADRAIRRAAVLLPAQSWPSKVSPLTAAARAANRRVPVAEMTFSCPMQQWPALGRRAKCR